MIPLAVRITFSLVVVLALMWGLARLARGPISRHGGMGGLSVVARQQLSRNCALVVVRLGERGLILGVTDQQVRLLGETGEGELEVLAEPARRRALPVVPRPGTELDPSHFAGSAPSRRTWSQIVEALRERTARQR
jgi:flagellar protein FliO/FliZ